VRTTGVKSEPRNQEMHIALMLLRSARLYDFQFAWGCECWEVEDAGDGPVWVGKRELRWLVFGELGEACPADESALWVPGSSISGYVQPKLVLWLRCGNCRSRSCGGVLGRCGYFRLCRRRVGVRLIDGLEERC